jgi:hypothetical protein
MISYRIILAILSLGVVQIDIARADDWMLRVETSSRVCHVQLKTASPLGSDMSGPFSSQEDACQEAARQFDSSLSDQSKCWTYGAGTRAGCHGLPQ